jgi:maltooligosyltrehalose trehalohydrolase
MARGGPRLGATPLPGGACEFLVWAPAARQVELRLLAPAAPEPRTQEEARAGGEARAGRDERLVPLEPREHGYHGARVPDVPPGTRYLFRLDGADERPDPASRAQPDGVHGPSAVVDARFEWSARSWRGLPLQEHVIYEVHVGTFTQEGTFDAVVPRVPQLKELGVTALELMPVAQFPGERNWGYDGVYPFAVQGSYGGADGLRRLVDACHREGLAVILDVVFNHLGPEGNYLSAYGPYFTERYATPWGHALNFDGAGSDEVRRYFLDNALEWVTDYRIDALRLDAVHAMLDTSALHVLEEMAQRVGARAAELDRRIFLFPESDLNDPRLVQPPGRGGYGLDAQWCDDFHHAVHALLTGERAGYYADYGRLEHLARAYRDAYVYAGDYSTYRGRRHGRPAAGVPAHRFIVFTQNHDQVGNRLLGERLTGLVELDRLRLAAGAALLSPYIPLIFMGEEYGEPGPFPYFVSHTDEELVRAVREGRREEFAGFGWQHEPPDPQAEETFAAARLNRELADEEERHRQLRDFYKELLRLRRMVPALRELDRERLEVATREHDDGGVLLVRRRSAGGDEVALLLHFGEGPQPVPAFPALRGHWAKLIDAADPRWGGSGPVFPDTLHVRGRVGAELAPWAFVALRREE